MQMLFLYFAKRKVSGSSQLWTVFLDYLSALFPDRSCRPVAVWDHPDIHVCVLQWLSAGLELVTIDWPIWPQPHVKNSSETEWHKKNFSYLRNAFCANAPFDVDCPSVYCRFILLSTLSQGAGIALFYSADCRLLKLPPWVPIDPSISTFRSESLSTGWRPGPSAAKNRTRTCKSSTVPWGT